MNEVTFAEPWLGEFGWEVMHWAPRLRRLSRTRDVAVCAHSRSKILYEDFCVSFHPHEFLSERCTGAKARDSFIEKLAAELSDQICRDNKYTHRIRPGVDLNAECEFIELGREFSVEPIYDVVIHPRSRAQAPERNYHITNWIDLIERLQGLRIAVMNVPQAYRLGATSAEEIVINSVADTVKLFRSCALFVGPDSGVLHLAGLCRTPRLTWIKDEHNGTFKCLQSLRITGKWNPLNTHTEFVTLSSFQPLPACIAEKIRRHSRL